jgi:hypothetical protein
MWQQHWRDASLGPSSRCPRPRHSVPAVKQTRVDEKLQFRTPPLRRPSPVVERGRVVE